MYEIISKIMPIILLISFGYIIKYKRLYKQSTIDEIKEIVINVSFPSILFITFLNMELKEEHFFVVVGIVFLLVLLYSIGIIVNKIKVITHPLNPMLVTAFSFGLLGIPLYRTAFGVENLDKLLILGVGNEIFIWFIFVPLIKINSMKQIAFLERIKGFIKSPLILSIIFGVIFNIAGLGIMFEENYFLKGIIVTLEYLGSLATPLILIIIGYGLKFTKKYMRQSVKLITLRIVITLTIGYILKYLFFDNIIQAEPFYNYAYFTLLIMPPPFALPIFISDYGGMTEYKELANNTVVLSTVVSIIIFIIFVFLI